MRAEKKSMHVTPVGGNVFADLGFDAGEAAGMKAESDIVISEQLAALKSRRSLEPADHAPAATIAAIQKVVIELDSPSARLFNVAVTRCWCQSDLGPGTEISLHPSMMLVTRYQLQAQVRIVDADFILTWVLNFVALTASLVTRCHYLDL